MLSLASMHPSCNKYEHKVVATVLYAQQMNVDTNQKKVLAIYQKYTTEVAMCCRDGRKADDLLPQGNPH